ncbi:MAG: 2Fe-2S iron-sulfur cluster binding domain-containing protein [Nevskiaceae bacterium]|nr:MAG: 2Fe-2S iron-sulfur cluster binding domain-containing protein [Nevskiaceae bacterium]TBR73713.1 MAG: 2Fe-2S iron-sulfur cluster binding domain-containing protein [Nevskiaceae bacterium]
MTSIRAVWRDGTEHEMGVPDGASVMETLRDDGADVEGTCGGECACGTCHVYVDAEWLDRLPLQSGEELDMLDAVSGLVEVRPSSRLSCQIRMHPALAGLRLEVAPEA